MRRASSSSFSRRATSIELLWNCTTMPMAVIRTANSTAYIANTATRCGPPRKPRMSVRSTTTAARKEASRLLTMYNSPSFMKEPRQPTTLRSSIGTRRARTSHRVSMMIPVKTSARR